MAVTQDTIAQDLEKIGLASGDWVFLHSSLKSLGWVEGGPSAVINAFLSVIGQNGLFVVPTLTPTTHHMKEKSGVIAWNKHSTPSRVGAITDTLWRMPEAFRSDHPTHSVAAIGREASEYVKDHSYSLPTFSLKSPFAKHVRHNAKCMFLGVGLGSNTTLHAFEEWIKLPYLETADTLIEDKDGDEITVQVTGFPSGCRGFYRNNGTHVASFIEEGGLVSRGSVADAEVMTVPSLDLADLLFDKMYDEPGFLLCRKPECEFCAKGRIMIEKNLEHIHAQYPDIREAGLYRGDKGVKQKESA